MGKIKHIRWIAVIGLLAIIELQYVWLTNTYKLTEESLLMKSDALFKDAALQEVFCRMEKYKKMMSSKDTTFTIYLEEDPDTLSADMMKNRANQWLMSSLHIAFQKAVLKELKMEVSLTDYGFNKRIKDTTKRKEIQPCSYGPGFKYFQCNTTFVDEQ